jgi:ribosomal protein L21
MSLNQGALFEVRIRRKTLAGQGLSKDHRTRKLRDTHMFAVLKTGGKQYKVANGDVLKVEKLAGNAGDTVQFNEILMLGGDDVTVGAPLVAGAGVQAEILEQAKGPKVINYVKRRRKHSSQRKNRSSRD